MALLVASLGLVAAPGAPAARANAAPATPSAPPPANAVVLELFTSQGCSTCPPADALLSRLAAEPQWQGRLVPLALHVDYWNQQGWRDPFSSAAWSDRQQAYARALSTRGPYTPEAVINGRRECVGSVEADVRRLLAEQAAVAAGRVELRLTRNGARVTADVTAVSPPAHTGPLDLLLAVYESGLETAVAAGENAHRTLHDDYVVRRLDREFRLRSGERRDTVTVHLAHDWNPERLGIAAFLQDPSTREIFGAAAAPVPR